jgi:hypothetical protein
MSHRTVDFVGTTHSTRFGRSTSAVQSVPERVSTLGQLDELKAEALPAMHELMNLGASFSVYHGCPMLRAENVPRTPESDALVAKVACEFGSEAMQCVVQNALIRNETDEVDISVLGGDDENDDDGRRCCARRQPATRRSRQRGRKYVQRATKRCLSRFRRFCSRVGRCAAVRNDSRCWRPAA